MLCKCGARMKVNYHSTEAVIYRCDECDRRAEQASSPAHTFVTWYEVEAIEMIPREVAA